MRKTKTSFLIGAFLLIVFCVKAQDTSKYIRFGLVPYQLLSRSAGAYLSYKNEKYVLEYRPTYTIATKNKTLPFLFSHFGYDYFFFQGINNNLILGGGGAYKQSVRLIFIQRTWWYANKRIPVDNVPSTKEVAFANQSALMYGLGMGVEMSWDMSDEALDWNLFLNMAITRFDGTRNITSSQLSGYQPTSHSREFFMLNVAFGMEIGYRKGLKQKTTFP